MKYYLLHATFIFVIFLQFSAFSQSILQLNSYYSSTDSKAKSTCFSNSGSVYVTGEFKDEIIIGFNSFHTNGRNAVYWAKQTSNGDVPFMKTFVGTGSVFVSTIESFGDTILVAGTYTDSLFIGTDTLYNEHFKGIYIGLYDTLGNFLNSWTTNSYSAELYDCKISESGHIVGCGEYFGDLIFGTTTLQSTLGFNYFLFTMDRNSFASNWIESSSGSATNARKIDFDDAGNIYICGSYGDGTIIQGNNLSGVSGDHNLFLAKYDADGDVMLVRTLTGPVQTHGLSLAVSNQGDIYLGGEYEMNLNIPNVGMLINEGLMDGFLVKLNANGDFLWGENIGTVDNDASVDIALDIHQNPIVLVNAGKTLNVQGIDMNSGGYFDPILVKFNKDSGIPFWHFRIPSVPQTGIVSAYDFAIRDSIISICGSNKTGIVYFGDTLDSPNLSDSFWAIIKDSTTQISQNSIDEFVVDNTSIYPNPFVNCFRIQSSLTDIVSVEMIDFKATNIKLNRQLDGLYFTDDNLSPGIYLLKITTPKKVILTKLLHL